MNISHYLLAFVLLCSLTACNMTEEGSTLAKNISTKKIWTFIQFNVPEENDKIDSYYYYGLISQTLYHEIRNGDVDNGFIHLEQVKYWGDDDLIYNYADAENYGDLVFRIEDIRRIKLVKQAPKAGLGAEQFETSPPTVTPKNNTDAIEGTKI